MNIRKNVMDEVVMPGEKFAALEGEISRDYRDHVNNAYKIEKQRLNGKKLSKLQIEMRLKSIRAEARQELASMLMEFPGRFMLTDSFTAEDFAFLYSTSKELISKKARLEELKEDHTNEEG